MVFFTSRVRTRFNGSIPFTPPSSVTSDMFMSHIGKVKINVKVLKVFYSSHFCMFNAAKPARLWDSRQTKKGIEDGLCFTGLFLIRRYNFLSQNMRSGILMRTSVPSSYSNIIFAIIIICCTHFTRFILESGNRRLIGLVGSGEVSPPTHSIDDCLAQNHFGTKH